MSAADPDPDACFDDLTRALTSRPGVRVGSGRRGFGADALQVDGRIFAFVRRGQLVLKLPATRVAALIEAGAGDPFDAGKGRPMREWVAIRLGAGPDWLALAEEALAFVGGSEKSARRR